MTQKESFEIATGMSIEAMQTEVKKLNAATTTTPALEEVKARLSQHFAKIPQTIETIEAELEALGFTKDREVRDAMWHNKPTLARFEGSHASNPFELKVWRAMFNGTSGRYGGRIYYKFNQE